jgi:hypothetical protein
MPKDDLFQDRHLLRIADYQFQDGEGTRDKFMIVLNRDDESAYIIHTLTTSQPYGFDPKKSGCHKFKNISYFYFPKDVEIAENGFKFISDTFVFFRDNIRKEELKFLSKYPEKDIEFKGVMKKSSLKELIDCMLNSDFITPEQSDRLLKTRNTL